MSALSTPGGGGTTAQSKPTSGKQKFQKLDINSLYCANRNENTEPLSVKSQLSRKHGMQILGKVPSARRPPANLPSLKTESGQETITSSATSSSSTTTTTTPTCTPQTAVPVVGGTNVAAVGAPGGWVSLPPPSSAHFRTEFPTLEAASHASYRTDHPQQPSLRPQTEGSWTSGGSAGVRPESTSQSATQAPTGNAQQTPALRAILPSFLKGSGSHGLGTGSVASLRESRPAPRASPRPSPRPGDALSARPILRDEQISSLDEISHDAGWAQHDDIDYDQKLDFSDGESSAPKSAGRSSKGAHRGGADNERQETKVHDVGDEEQIWAERRQKQNNEVAAAVARARQRKEEEQRRQMRDNVQPQHKEQDARVKDKSSRDRSHSRDRERLKTEKKDDRDWVDDKVIDAKEQYENKDKIDRSRDIEKERIDNRDRFDRDRERDKGDRDYRDRDYGRNREQVGNAYSQNYKNMPPRFLKKQQNRQEEEIKGNWSFPNKPPMRRQESNQSYNAPRHNGRRSFSRDYSDREDEYRREKDGPQWRHEMQDYEKGRDVDRQNSKESFREYNDYKERKPSENTIELPSRTSAAEKLSEVFERKSVTPKDCGVSNESQSLASGDRRPTPPSSQRESSERDYGKISWAEDDQYTASKRENIENKDGKKPEVEPHQPVSQPANFSQAVKMSSSLTHTSDSNMAKQADHSNAAKSVQSQPKLESADATVTIPATNIKPTTDQNVPQVIRQKTEKDLSESESVASKSSIDPGNKFVSTSPSAESLQKRSSFDEKKSDTHSENSMKNKEPVERKSSGSGSEKRSRGYGGGSGGFVYASRGWGQKESRGRRSHLSSRSKNRASESDGSTDGPINSERKDRRRAPRSPRAHKKVEKLEEEVKGADGEKTATENKPDEVETREPFAPRGQPSRRGRGGFQGVSRPPAPVKRVAGYGPPNTKSPFSQANRAKEDIKDGAQVDDKNKSANKHRTGSSGRGRDRRNKVGCPSGEDENWETTSEHSEGGNGVRRRSIGNRQQKPQGNRNQQLRQNNRGKREGPDFKANEETDAMANLKLKKDEVAEDGFQEVRNKKISKDGKGPVKDETSASSKPARNAMTGGGRNNSSSRNANDKLNNRGGSSMNKTTPQYERSRVSNLPPRFAKQLQKQQTGMGGDTNVAPPPPLVNAWEKPIAQSLRGNSEDPSQNTEIENKPNQVVQRQPVEAVNEPKNAIVAPCNYTASVDKTGVLDGSTPPVETIIFENTNYKSTPPAEALKPKYQQCANAAKSQAEEIPIEIDGRNITFNGDVRGSTRTIQELIAENGRPTGDGDNALGIQMSFEDVQKTEDSSDMKLDFAFDSDLGHLTDDKNSKSLGIARATHISTSNTISPLAADLNFKIASVKKVWEMPAVVENTEELQFTGFEEANTEAGSAPNVCKVKPTQQLQSPPPQHYNHVGYQGYGGLSVPSPPAVIYNSSQQLLGNSQQLAQQSGLYGAFLDQNRQQFGGFPGAPYAAGSAAPYNYQPPPDMFQSLPSQYHRMAAAAAGGGAAFGQSAQLANNPSTVLISNTSNSLMSASGKPPAQQIGAIGSKAGAVGGVNSYGQQYLGYSGPVGDAYSLTGLLPRPAPPTNSYYSPYQATPAAPTYPLQFTQPAQSPAPFQSQYLSSQLQVAAAVQQMQQQQQYRAPMQQQYAPRPHQQQPQPQQLKSPLHENGFNQMCEAASPTPKAKMAQGTHSPTHHKYSHPPPTHVAQPIAHHQMVGLNNNGRGNNGGANANGGNMPRVTQPPRYPSPIQRPLAPAPQMYRPQHRHAPNNAPTHQHRNAHMQHNNHYHYQQQRGGNNGVPMNNAGPNATNQERATEAAPGEVPAAGKEEPEAMAAAEGVAQDAKAE